MYKNVLFITYYRVHINYWLFIISTALHDGNSGQVKRGIPTYRRREGENIRVECKFSYSGTKKFFCKGKCEKRNILIETTENAAKNDRYSIQYVEKSVLSSDILYVSIGQLKKSDTGPYMCLSKTWLRDLSREFYILVTEGEFQQKYFFYVIALHKLKI